MSAVTIPISLCIYTIKNRCYKETELLVYLKSKSSGFIEHSSSIVMEYANDTKKSEKTYYNALKELKKKQWIYPVAHGLRLKSFAAIVNSISDKDFVINKGAYFNSSFTLFKSFLCAATITYIGKQKKWVDKHSGTNKGDAFMRMKSTHFSLPHTFLAMHLGVTKSTAQRIRNCAKSFISVQHKTVSYDLDIAELAEFKEHNPNIGDRLRVKKCKDRESGKVSYKVILQLSDHIASSIHLKRCHFFYCKK